MATHTNTEIIVVLEKVRRDVHGAVETSRLGREKFSPAQERNG